MVQEGRREDVPLSALAHPLFQGLSNNKRGKPFIVADVVGGVVYCIDQQGRSNQVTLALDSWVTEGKGGQAPEMRASEVEHSGGNLPDDRAVSIMS